MDRISDSGSDGCGSIPHGGTKAEAALLSRFFLYNTFFLQYFMALGSLPLRGVLCKRHAALLSETALAPQQNASVRIGIHGFLFILVSVLRF